MSTTNRLLAVVFSFLATTVGLLAQAEGESPYSSSTVDTPAENSFSTNGFVIVAVLVFLGLLLFVFLRGRRRA